MARKRVWTAIAVATLGALALSAPAGAATWKRITSEAQPSNTSETGLERTADGVLHVLWPRDSGATEQVMHSAIAANGGSIMGPHLVAATTNFVNNSVDLVAGSGGGLRAFFSGLFPTTTSDEMRSATAPAAGTPWTAHVAASSTSSSTNPAGGKGIGAAVSPATGYWSAWGDSSSGGGGFHVGVTTTADAPFSSSCCQGDPNVAVDSASGAVAIGWNNLTIGGSSTLQVIFGSPAQTAPQSGAVWPQQRVGLTGRIGAGGIYAAYGSGTNPFNAKPALWRVGTPSAKVINQPPDAEHTTLAPAPGGRLWIAWEGKDRGKRIFATRTNPAATRFGAISSTKPPPGTDQIHRLNVEGSLGFLDVVALANRGGGDIAHWTARLKPGLTLAAKPKKVAAGAKVKFKVTDAGAPVAGAKVKLNGAGSDTTNASGKATVKVPNGTKPGKYAARATKGGYESAKRKVKVKK